MTKRMYLKLFSSLRGFELLDLRLNRFKPGVSGLVKALVVCRIRRTSVFAQRSASSARL
jgi:hypothetical protein